MILNRNQVFEKILSTWRSRNATRWKDESNKLNINNFNNKIDLNKLKDDENDIDFELKGKLDSDINLHDLLNALSFNSDLLLVINNEMRNKLQSVLPSFEQKKSKKKSSMEEIKKIIIPSSKSEEIERICRKINKYTVEKGINDNSMIGLAHDELENSNDFNIEIDENIKLNNGQKQLIEYILLNFKNKKQNLCFMHGGAGVGKSTVIKTIEKIASKNNMEIISTSPTGNAATLLNNGKTFHHAFKAFTEELSAKDIQKMKVNFNENVLLIIIDEVSMFSSQNLVLLDKRLRLLYDENKNFGGNLFFLVEILFKCHVLLVLLCTNQCILVLLRMKLWQKTYFQSLKFFSFMNKYVQVVKFSKNTLNNFEIYQINILLGQDIIFKIINILIQYLVI